MHGGHRQPAADGRQPRPQPDAQQAAAGEGIQGLHRLVARPERVAERVEPVVDPQLDVPEQRVQDPRAGDEQEHPADHVRRAARRHVQHREEHGKEQQGRSEVPLHDHDPERDREHRDHRREVRQRRQADRPDSRALVGQQGAVLRQVAGEEDDEDHLQELGRLPGQRADREREAGAVDVAAEHERQQQQGDPGGRPRVLVGPQPGVRSDGEREDRDHRQRDQEPAELELAEPEHGVAELLDDELLRQPLHQQQADAAEERRGRQQHLVGAPTGQDERDVDDEQRDEVGHETAEVRGREVDRPGRPAGAERLLRAQPGAERGPADEQRDRHQDEQGELRPAACAAGSSSAAATGACGTALTRDPGRGGSEPRRSGARRRTPAPRRDRPARRSRTCRSCSRGPRRTRSGRGTSARSARRTRTDRR